MKLFAIVLCMLLANIEDFVLGGIFQEETFKGNISSGNSLVEESCIRYKKTEYVFGNMKDLSTQVFEIDCPKYTGRGDEMASDTSSTNGTKNTIYLSLLAPLDVNEIRKRGYAVNDTSETNAVLCMGKDCRSIGMLSFDGLGAKTENLFLRAMSDECEDEETGLPLTLIVMLKCGSQKEAKAMLQSAYGGYFVVCIVSKDCCITSQRSVDEPLLKETDYEVSPGYLILLVLSMIALYFAIMSVYRNRFLSSQAEEKDKYAYAYSSGGGLFSGINTKIRRFLGLLKRKMGLGLRGSHFEEGVVDHEIVTYHQFQVPPEDNETTLYEPYNPSDFKTNHMHK